MPLGHPYPYISNSYTLQYLVPCQKHIPINIGWFGANRCHVHVRYINNMCITAAFPVFMTVCLLSRQIALGQEIPIYSETAVRHYTYMQEMKKESRYNKSVKNRFCCMLTGLFSLAFKTPQ